MNKVPENTPSVDALLIGIAGFALLSFGDAFIKSTSGLWPSTGITALRFAFGALGLGLLLLIRQGHKAFRLSMPWHQLARGFFLAIASLAFFSSIFVMSLAEATAIQFISPMLTAIISAVILKEPAPRYVWAAIIMGFAGVIIILRPNVAALGWAVILPLIAALCMSCLMILNRSVAGRTGVLQAQFWMALFATPILILSAWLGHIFGGEDLAIAWPPVFAIAICALVALTASCSHGLVYMATARASAAYVAPTVYVQIIVAIALGIVLYGDYPDAVSLGGVGLVIFSGLYMWWRGYNTR